MANADPRMQPGTPTGTTPCSPPEWVRENGGEYVLCDLGKVLVYFDHRTIGAGLAAYLPDSGGEASAIDRLYRFFFVERVEGATRNILLDRGRHDLAWIGGELRRHLGASIPPEELHRIWSDIFTHVDAKMPSALRSLRAAGIRVGLCSSTNAAHFEWVCARFPELCDCWDDEFLTYRMGLAKTDPGFFETIARTTGVAIGRHLFIDDLETNVAAAASAGLRAFQYPKDIPFA